MAEGNLMTETEKPPGPPGREAFVHAQSSVDDTYRYLSEMAEDFVAEVKIEWDKYRAQDGDVRRLKGLLGSELTTLLRLAKETEGSLNGIRGDRAGKAGAYAINFEDARSEIGRQLDNIRAACLAADVPRQPDGP